MFHIKQQSVLHKTVTSLRYCSLFPFGTESYESVITVTLEVPENMRNTAKARDVNIFYRNDAVTAEEC